MVLCTLIDNCEKCPKSAYMASEPGTQMIISEKDKAFVKQKKQISAEFATLAPYLLYTVEFHPRTSILPFVSSSEI